MNWIIDGLPPNLEIWKPLIAQSKAAGEEVKSKRAVFEARRAAEAKAKKQAEEAMEEDGADGGVSARNDPAVVAAREAAEAEAGRPMPIDPLPTITFELKDGLPDYALLMHRLYLMKYGPLKGEWLFSLPLLLDRNSDSAFLFRVLNFSLRLKMQLAVLCCGNLARRKGRDFPL